MYDLGYNNFAGVNMKFSSVTTLSRTLEHLDISTEHERC